ncbi:MAG: hypothetical protein K9L62_14215 [Vallitaleaceae bacterium]|nr:hypothetical protein [Vallitaleaceae bacterium]
MKKSRLIALGLVLTMMLMGSAYAAWTQTVDVNATIETGDLEVMVAKVGDRSGVIPTAQNQDDDGVEFAPDFELTTADSSITIEGSNFFPGASGVAVFTVENTGSIPVDIRLDESSVKGKLEELATFQFSGGISINGSNVSGTSGYKNTVADLFGTFGKVTLMPGDVAKFPLQILFRENADIREDKTYNLKFDLDVSQFNID